MKCLLEICFSWFLCEIIFHYRTFFILKGSAAAERVSHFTHFGMEVKRDFQLQTVFSDYLVLFPQ